MKAGSRCANRALKSHSVHVPSGTVLVKNHVAKPLRVEAQAALAVAPRQKKLIQIGIPIIACTIQTISRPSMTLGTVTANTMAAATTPIAESLPAVT